jgi:hypothetical protein
MCDQFGSCCQLCAKGVAHPKKLSVKKRGEYLRGLGHTALEIGANQVAQMDAHYAKQGIRLGHRRTRDGIGYEPACLVGRDLERCLKARGLRE